jgi:hypothetical protein
MSRPTASTPNLTNTIVDASWPPCTGELPEGVTENPVAVFGGLVTASASRCDGAVRGRRVAPVGLPASAPGVLDVRD